jgi:replicative DNA helicase
VLGAALLSQDAVRETLGVLGHNTDAFFLESHRLIYGAVLALHDSDRPVDVISVRAELERTGNLKQSGGAENLNALTDSISIPGNSADHAQMVLEKAALRSMAIMADDLARDIDLGEMPASELVARFQQSAIEAARLTHQSGTIQSWPSILAEFGEDFAKRKAHPTGVLGLSTGFSDLDDMLGGVDPGDLVTIGAWTSRGKSALVEQIARWVAENGGPVLYVSLEMSALQTARRFISRMANINLTMLRKGRGSQDAVLDAMRRHRDLPLYVDASGKKTVERIIATTRTAQMRYGIKLLIVDHLQLVTPSHGFTKLHEATGHISGSLKCAAMDCGMPVILISQLRRPQNLSPDSEPKPSLHTLKESGSIENDSDVVLLLHRPEFHEPMITQEKAELIIAKQRNGPTGVVRLAFVRPTAEFRGLSIEEVENREENA